MTLAELIDVIDYNRDSTTQMIQMCRCGGEWDEFDETVTSSTLLLPLYTAKVKEIDAIDENVFRVDIDWDEINTRTHLYEWEGKQNETT